MRAQEFLIEKHVGKIGRRKSQSTVGLNKFRDADLADRFYELNRVMMAVASTDGTFVPDIDGESWAGKFNTAHAYTETESDMLKQAYKAAGIKYKDLNSGDDESKELDSTNIKSPIKPFKGYKK